MQTDPCKCYANLFSFQGSSPDRLSSPLPLGFLCPEDKARLPPNPAHLHPAAPDSSLRPRTHSFRDGRALGGLQLLSQDPLCQSFSQRTWQCLQTSQHVCASSVAQSRLTVQLNGLQPARLLCPWDSPGKNTGVGCHALLQGIFLTQGWNLCLLCLLPWQAGSLSTEPPGALFGGPKSCNSGEVDEARACYTE